MATLTIKNLPDALYAELKAKAAEHRRSLNSEAILAVEQSLTQGRLADPAKILAEVRRGRARLKGLFLTDKDLRAARQNGRA
ncbi:MAG: Arc family DNA-binding protein [Gemmatimonadales bacterium]